jgi:CheY-like chemotaxis protein
MSSSSGAGTIRTHMSELSPPRILVVDDEAPIRTYVDRVLRGKGYRTALAMDGADALRTAAELRPFDLLITDLHMPQMMGDELARRLRQEQDDLKVLYLTGYGDELWSSRVAPRDGTVE